MRLYLAGPLFSTAERDFNDALARGLRQRGHEVWLPQEHEQRAKTGAEIFIADVAGLDWADVVVANMDGADPDSGTCWECGYAYGKKPVIVFRSDFRVEHAGKGALQSHADGIGNPSARPRLCRDGGDRPAHRYRAPRSTGFLARGNRKPSFHDRWVLEGSDGRRTESDGRGRS